MMRSLALLLALVTACAHADVGLKNHGSTIGPVTSIDCALDGGLACSRATGSSTGKLTCETAAPGVSGCVSSGTQTFGGAKTFDNGLSVNGPVFLDGGVYVNGPVLLDGGVQVNGSLFVDGGITAKTSIVAGASVKAESGQFIGPTASDGGIGRLNLANGRDVASITTVGIQAIEGVNLPHSAGINGHVSGGLGQGVADKAVMKERMPGSGQFQRVSVTVDRTGSGDGGLQVDGGPTQGYYASIYNATTGAYLCQTAHTACNVTGSFSTACGLDGGARFALLEDVELRVHNVECLDAPSVNVGGRYIGPTSP